MIKIISIIFLLLITTTLSPSVYAATSTPSATSTTTASEVEENVQNRLKNIIQEKLSTTEAQLREKIGQLSLVGYVGKFTAISSESITLQSNGDSIQVGTTSNTTINKNGVAKFSSLAIGDKAIVIGTMTLKNVIDAKRIIIVKDEPTELPSIVTGKIVSADPKTRKVIITSHNANQNIILSRKANVKIETLLPGKTIIGIFEFQSEDLVITTAKVF